MFRSKHNISFYWEAEGIEKVPSHLLIELELSALSDIFYEMKKGLICGEINTSMRILDHLVSFKGEWELTQEIK